MGLKKLIFIALTYLIITAFSPSENKEIFEFQFEGVTLNGVLNMPVGQKTKGMVLIVHGSGQTNAVAGDWYSDIRKTFVSRGYSTYMWDKMGSGNSGGTFDYNQTVENSALEVIAAINALKQAQIPGFNDIALYGGSRASWVNPIVINQYKDIRFWISVSGVDDKENFPYLLKQNLIIEGYSPEEAEAMQQELLEANRLAHSGASFEAVQAVMPTLKDNPFWLRLTNGGIKREEFYRNQSVDIKKEFDYESGLPVVVKDFSAILSKIDIPVLALFGERDMNVNWRKTKSFYEAHLAPNTDLTIQSFPGCNHNMFQAKTGGFYEFQDNDLPWVRCEGFLEAINHWLKEKSSELEY